MNRTLLLSVCALLVAAAAAQTPALRRGVSVQMPVTKNAVAAPEADLADSLIVAVTFHGSVYLGATQVTPVQLSAEVRAGIEGQPGKRVYLKGDARTPYSSVAEVLDALRKARVNAPILLTDQRDPTDVAYVLPTGLEVLLPVPAPEAAKSTTLKVGSGQASDTELNRHARRDSPIVLQADGSTPFGDLVHAVDVCRGVGAKVFLATLGQNTGEGKDTSAHEEHFVQANGIKLHYLDWGGDGEPLVFLTGYGATAIVFDSLARRFNKRFHVLAFTRRGRAPSERTPSGYDLKTLTSDLQGFLDALGLRRVHLAGHSFGGAEMTEFATLHPERVISLVYLDAALDAAAGDAAMKEAPFPPPKPPPGSPYAQVLEWWTSYTPDFSHLRSPALALYAVQDRNPYIPRDASEASRQRGDEFWQTRWTPMKRRIAEKFGREAPNSRVVVLENTSHYLFRDKEEEVVQEMEKFYVSITDSLP